jgi:uncharacterized membrane protein YbhN (UPF0104 family)
MACGPWSTRDAPTRIPAWPRRRTGSLTNPVGRRNGRVEGAGDPFRRHPIRTLAMALALAALAVVLVGFDAGWGAVASGFRSFAPTWLLVVLGGQLIAFAGYVLSYRIVAGIEAGRAASLALAARLVLAGFGAFAPGGGLLLDRRAVAAMRDNEREATVRVLGLAGLEYAVIAPVACAAAIVLLVRGSPIQGAVLWPWALAVPLGFALGLWLASPGRRRRIAGQGWIREKLATLLDGIAVIPVLARTAAGWGAFAGMALYWGGEVVSLWGSVESVGGELAAGPLIIGLATGWALTRRSTPLAGAGVTEALMSFALLWVGLGLGTALAATIVYRVFTLALPSIPALLARKSVAPLLSGDVPHDRSAERQREAAEAVVPSSASVSASSGLSSRPAA